jgi:hypothetical protein
MFVQEKVRGTMCLITNASIMRHLGVSSAPACMDWGLGRRSRDAVFESWKCLNCSFIRFDAGDLDLNFGLEYAG